MLGRKEPVLSAEPDVAGTAVHVRPADSQRTRQSFVAVIAASATFLLLYAHFNALRYDEVLTYYTVDHASLKDLLHFQLTTPIVLEPPVFDGILWLASKIFGLHIFALRLPGLLSFVLMQAFVFALLRRFSLLAACLGVLLFLPCSIVSFGPEIRPYGFILLCTAALVWFWQTAIERARAPWWAFVGIAAAVFLATLSQFYGVLIVVPVIAGELVRLLKRGRRSVGVWLALAAAIPSVAFDIPFVHAVKPYQQFLSPQDHFNLSTWVATYLVFINADLRMGSPVVAVLMFTLVVVAVPLCCVLAFPWKREFPDERVRCTELQPLWAAFCVLAVLPGLVLTIAHVVTHTYSPRHAISCAVGLCSLVAIVFSRALSRLSAVPYRLVVVCILMAITAGAVYNLVDRASFLERVKAANQPSPAVMQQLQAHPEEQLYLTVDVCLTQAIYGDPAVRARERCLYSREREIRYSHQVIVELTARALGKGTAFPLEPVPYDDFRAAGQGMLVYHDEDWEHWIPDSLQADGAHVQPIGSGFGGDVSQVIFPATQIH